MRWYFSTPVGISVVALLLTWLWQDPDPSPDLLRTLAGIGVSFYLAYVIEASWLAQRLRLKSNEHSEIFFEAITGIALSGLLGIAFALVLGEHADNAPLDWPDTFYFWWSVTALGALGVLVAIQPVLVLELRSNDSKGQKRATEDD